MTKRWLLAAVAGLVGTSMAWAQVPVGNQSTFGRTPPGRSFPFLNNHGYGGTAGTGIPFPGSSRHAYGSSASNNGPSTGRPAPSPGTSTASTTPNVPPAFKAPPGLIFGTGNGQIFKAPFFPFSGVQSGSPTISTVAPGSFQSATFPR